MQLAYGRRLEEDGALAHYHAAAPLVSASPAWVPTGRYGETHTGRPNWKTLSTILFAHVALLFALVKLDIIHVAKAKPPPPLVVELVAEPPAPPPTPPEVEPQPQKPVAPQIVVPTPMVRMDTPPPPVAVTNAPPPPQAVIVAPPAPRPVPSTPVSVPDLSSSVLSMVRPRIPLESRRLREGGTVAVLVTLGLDGRVEQASLSRSSGFSRLDDAVIEAVRRWRWSPTMRGGEAMRVRGVVEVTISPPA